MRCISKEEYGEDSSNVGYALYVRDNIKPGDYFKTNTGEIFRSITKYKAGSSKIYYANGDYYWVDILAIRDFEENIIDLVQEGDYVNGSKVNNIDIEDGIRYLILDLDNCLHDTDMISSSDEIKSIVTKEQFKSIEFILDKWRN